MSQSKRERLEDAIGEVCRVVIPVKEQFFLGRGNKIAICTLGSMKLLSRIAESDLMGHICIAGRLLSENRGIEQIIDFSLSRSSLEMILLCGSEVAGHFPGQSLVSLHKNGIDDKGRIIGAIGHRPILRLPAADVDKFRTRVKLVNLIGVNDLERIASLVT